MHKQTIQLVHEFTCHIGCGTPLDAGTGPYGSRQYYEIIGGSVAGPRLTGKLVGSGGDWMLTGTDGYMRMDVRVQIETEDGAVICAHYFGPAVSLGEPIGVYGTKPHIAGEPRCTGL